MDPSSFIVNKLLTDAYNELKTYLRKKGVNLLSDEKFVKETVLDHITFVNNWSKTINFKDLDRPKNVSKTYVDLEYFLNLRRHDLSENERKSITLKQILRKNNRHVVVLGQPGAGKTTTMKYICQSIFHSRSFCPEFKFPILIRLRDLSVDPFSKSTESLFERLFTTLGLRIDQTEQKLTTYAHSVIPVKQSVIKIIEELGALIILDGLDEINPSEKRFSILKEFEFLCLNLNNSKVILTSRVGDYSYSLDNTELYEISSLSEKQIRQFAKKWLVKKEKYEELHLQILQSPFYDTAIRPLTMAHLCALFEKYGRIPEKPKNVYRKVVNLLIEEWDNQRMVHRTSKFKDFTPDRKAEFLSILAFTLSSAIKSSIFNRSDLSRAYQIMHYEFGLTIQEEKEVWAELENQTGIFVQSGYDTFEFAHKSLQEYLTAEYLVRLPVITSGLDIIRLLPNEFAIATSISIDPSMYMATLVIRYFNYLDLTTVKIFLNRILLENPDFRLEPLLGSAILYIKRLSKVQKSCNDLIHSIIKKIKPSKIHY